jgi:hypothetical protein
MRGFLSDRAFCSTIARAADSGFNQTKNYMILSDRDIKKALKKGTIIVDPLFPKSIQPASIDVHLGPDFLVFRTDKHTAIDPK